MLHAVQLAKNVLFDSTAFLHSHLSSRRWNIPSILTLNIYVRHVFYLFSTALEIMRLKLSTLTAGKEHKHLHNINANGSYHPYLVCAMGLKVLTGPLASFHRGALISVSTGFFGHLCWLLMRVQSSLGYKLMENKLKFSQKWNSSLLVTVYSDSRLLIF